MKKIVVDHNKCIGCGICVGTDPNHFDYEDSGLSHPISQENIEDASVQEAINACPVAAISIEEKKEEQED